MTKPRGFRPASYKPPRVASPKFGKLPTYKPPKTTLLPKASRSSAQFKMPKAPRPPAPTLLPRATRSAPSYRPPRPRTLYQEPYPYRSGGGGSLLGLAAKVFVGYKLFGWLRRKPKFPTGPMPLGNVVYLIEGPMGHVKIGTTTNLAARLRSLQTGSPVPLQVLAVCPGDERLESALHAQYARYRLSGEWFDLPPADRQDLLARMK